jgi:hypothetical protein
MLPPESLKDSIKSLFKHNLSISGFSGRTNVVFADCDYNHPFFPVGGEITSSHSIIINLDAIVFGGLHLFHNPKLNRRTVKETVKPPGQ